MPLARYFIYVGGTLLLLLFIADFSLPKLPAGTIPNEESYLIRIHSDQKWPERLVFDTSIPTITPAQPMTRESEKPVPPVVTNGPANERDAFAQLRDSRTNDAQPSGPAATKLKPQRQHIAKRRAQPPARLAWRQPQFGWFDQRMW